MSVHINRSSDDRRNDPVGPDDLLGYFHDGGKPRGEWRVGAEFEKFAVERGTGRHLTYAEPGGIRSILEALVERYAWEPHYEGEHLTTLSRDGAMISLEPGGQVEFSTPPLLSVSDIDAALQQHRTEIRSVTEPATVAWIASGVSPFQSADDIPLGIRPRHKLMAEYLPGRCPKAMEMMKATASTQVAFDYADEADAMRKFRVALTLSPIANAIWANSPYYAGKSTGYASYRSRVWLGMDPDRSGLLPDLLAEELSFERWVRYLLDVPMLFVCEEGAYLPADGLTFRRFMASGHGDYFPTLADWEIHLTTVFPEVRLKTFLEIRGADATRPALAVAIAAFWKGLLYDDEALTAAEAVCDAIAANELPRLFAETSETGLATPFAGSTVLDLARRIVRIALDGLKRQGEAVRYLEPIQLLIERGTSPGTDLLQRPQLSHAELVAAFEY